MIKQLIAILFAFVFIKCNSKTPPEPLKLSGRDTSYTTVDLALSIENNEYPRLTAMKIIFQTQKAVVVDSSGGKIVQELKSVTDSSYLVWYPMPVKDSTGKKFLKNKAGTGDSLMLKFIPCENRLILHDFNKRWPVKHADAGK